MSTRLTAFILLLLWLHGPVGAIYAQSSQGLSLQASFTRGYAYFWSNANGESRPLIGTQLLQTELSHPLMSSSPRPWNLGFGYLVCDDWSLINEFGDGDWEGRVWDQYGLQGFYVWGGRYMRDVAAWLPYQWTWQWGAGVGWVRYRAQRYLQGSAPVPGTGRHYVNEASPERIRDRPMLSLRLASDYYLFSWLSLRAQMAIMGILNPAPDGAIFPFPVPTGPQTVPGYAAPLSSLHLSLGLHFHLFSQLP